MDKIHELKQERAKLKDDYLAILETAEKEERNLNAEEIESRKKVSASIKDMDNRIEMAQEAENLRAEKAKAEVRQHRPGPAGGESREKNEQIKKYSFLRAVASQLPNGKLEGRELEMHQEAVKEARESGIELNGIGVPSFILEAQNRDMVVGTDTAGGHFKQTTIGQTIGALRPRLMTESLGASMLTGLRGDLKLPRHNGVTTGTWEGENDANAESTPTLNSITLTPNRVGAYTEISKQLTFQAENESVEAFVRRDLENAIKIAVDAAAINGAGSGGEPTGILGTNGIGSVVGGTNGATPNWADIVDLESAVAVDNADMGALAYLTTPGIRGYLKKTLLDSGSGLFIWPNDQRPNGYRAEVSTQVPSTLDKGTSTGVCHAIIFGNWNELIIANWAGIDLVVDPYTLAGTAKIKLVINSWWDIAVRHAESFAAMQDALTS